MHLDAYTLRDPPRALSLEWLLADGAGGYASSTVLLCGTRRYHGLWVPALKSPVDRRVLLSHFDERLTTDAGETFLSTTEYGGGFYPDGSPVAESFDLDPLPRLVSRVGLRPGVARPGRGEAGPATVEREVLLLRDGAGLCITYRIQCQGRWTLRLSPMLALRPMHHLEHERRGVHVAPLPAETPGFRCLSEGMPGLFLWADGGVTAAVNTMWYYGVLRREERRRGFDFVEDLLAPGWLTWSGTSPAEFHVFGSLDPPRPMAVDAERKAHVARRAGLVRRAGSPADARLQRLAVAADAFLVRRRVGSEDLASVIAGYPWFGDWGRDALVALPGLAMETGRLEEAEKVLCAFASATRDGLVPNCYSEETAAPQYNTVDASLWFLQAVAAYLAAGGRAAFARQHFWPSVCQIIGRYRLGTAFGIHADARGLITAGSPQTQLTWMDATSRGRPVTPRYGTAVEINALWVSGLALMDNLAGRLSLPSPTSADEIGRVCKAFGDLFWNPDRSCLYDCILPDGRGDPAIRPNQVLAVGLPHAPLSGDRAKAVVRTVRERLLTPRGLRTLAPGEPGYCGRYAGGPDERDEAYHQGTAWPWLLGPYVDAVFAVEDARCARAEAGQILEGLLDSMGEAGLGQIAEVFDGDPPHRPGGCIAQAWSVAAAIHIWKHLEATGGVP